MGKLGFYCFTQPPVEAGLTMRQKVQALTDEQRNALITSFREIIPSGKIDHKLGIAKDIIDYVYDGIDAIQEKCRSYMRQEVIITPAVLDEQGQVVTPAVMNTQPTTQVELKTIVSPFFIDDYPQLFITNVIQQMIDWSKWNGLGTFTFYKNNIIL